MYKFLTLLAHHLIVKIFAKVAVYISFTFRVLNPTSKNIYTLCLFNTTSITFICESNAKQFVTNYLIFIL